MSDLAHADVGPETHVALALTDKKALHLQVDYKGAQVSAGLYAEISPRQLLEELKKIIPGQIDDALINAAESALGL